MSKNRARLLILSNLMSFPTINNKDWGYNCGCDKPQIGDLVALSSAPPSKWYLSWLREYDPNNGWPKYLLESIDDGELCWWENVSLTVYSREIVQGRPSWQWDDKQFEVNDRWHKVCRNKAAYIMLPCQPAFNADGSVTLDVRIRFGWDEYRNPRTFPDWKKLTMKQMADYYTVSKSEYEATKKST